jgi:hypothetical protein
LFLWVTGHVNLPFRWFDWLKEQASSFGLICITGHLLDAFSEIPIQDQIGPCVDCLKDLVDKTWVAVWSGNHDQVSIPTPWLPTSEPLSSAGWLQEMEDTKLIADGRTELIENRLIATTIPYSPCTVDTGRLQRVITNLGCKNPFGPHLSLAAFGIGNDGAHDDQ